jgi:chromosome segregation ATPase
MNIFTRKKTLLATIANLEEQIRIQSREMASLRKANTDINQLWLDTKKKAKQFGEEREALKEELRAKGIEYSAKLGEKNRDIDLLNYQIREQQATIAELQDSNSGLASSVSEMKGKLREKNMRVRELCHRIEELKEKPQRKQGTFKQNDRKDTTQP